LVTATVGDEIKRISVTPLAGQTAQAAFEFGSVSAASSTSTSAPASSQRSESVEASRVASVPTQKPNETPRAAQDHTVRNY
ncbi:hypothetical protein ACSTIL_23600, partial [Vibrio parahaemolyticus]